MAKKWFGSLFGRQLSHGSETEEPDNLQQAFASPELVAQQISSEPQDPPQFEPQLQQIISEPQGPPQMQQMPPQIQQLNSAPQIPMPFLQQQQAQTASAPGGGEMNVAYKASNVIVRERIMKDNPDDIALLDSMKNSDIIVVRGTYDHIHLVMEAIGIPYTVINPADIMRMEFRPDQTVYVNCPNSFPPESAKKLEKFVKAGGQLITTDWALKHVIEVGFPNTVCFNGHSTGDEVVSIEIVDKEDEVLKGFIDQEKDAAPVWWLESSSYPIRILDKSKVKVLVRSDDLKRKYKDDAVIISFQHGEGIVYHMISHFYLQRSETRTKKQTMGSDAYAVAQNMTESSKVLMNEITKDAPQLNYGVVQSASTSSEFVSRGVLKQKRKYAGKF